MKVNTPKFKVLRSLPHKLYEIYFGICVKRWGWPVYPLIVFICVWGYVAYSLHLDETITVAENVAIAVAIVSIVIVCVGYISHLKRKFEEAVWFQIRMLHTLHDLMSFMLLYMAVKHRKEGWVSDLNRLYKIDESFIKSDVEDLRGDLEGIYKDFQLDLSVLQANHHIQPHIRNLVVELRRRSRRFFVHEVYEVHYLMELGEYVRLLLDSELWEMVDEIKTTYDRLYQLNSMLDKITKEL